MAITVITSHHKPEKNNLDLDVTVSGSVLTIPAGDFKVDGLDVSWGEQEFTLTQDPLKQLIIGYVAEDLTTGDVELLVDEILLDGDEDRYEFDDGLFRSLHILFQVTLPPNETDLDNADVLVWKTAPRINNDQD